MEDGDAAMVSQIKEAFPYQAWGAHTMQLMSWRVGMHGEVDYAEPGGRVTSPTILSACGYCDSTWRDDGRGRCSACGAPGGNRQGRRPDTRWVRKTSSKSPEGHGR